MAVSILALRSFQPILDQRRAYSSDVRKPEKNANCQYGLNSSVDASNSAEKKWVRVTANMSAGMYDLYEATGDH